MKRDYVTGKKKLKGNRVSHSQVKTIRFQDVNLQPVKVVETVNGKEIRKKIRVTTKTLKSIKKGKIANIRMAKDNSIYKNK